MTTMTMPTTSPVTTTMTMAATRAATAMARGYLDVYGDLLVRRPFAESPLPDRVTPLRPLDEARSFALGA